MIKKLLALAEIKAKTLFAGRRLALSPEEYYDEQLSACWKCYLDAQLEICGNGDRP